MKQEIENFLHNPKDQQALINLVSAMKKLRKDVIANLSSKEETGPDAVVDETQKILNNSKLDLSGIDYQQYEAAKKVLEKQIEIVNKLASKARSYQDVENHMGQISTLSNLILYLDENKPAQSIEDTKTEMAQNNNEGNESNNTSSYCPLM